MEEAHNVRTFVNDSIEKAIDDISKIYKVEEKEKNLIYYVNVDIKINKRFQEFKFIIYFKDFPLSIPKIYIVPGDLYRLKGIPHISPNGFVCTYDQTVITIMERPIEILELCIKKAKKIIKDGIEKKNKKDFEDEFIAYWEGENYEIIPTISTIDYTVENIYNPKFYYLKKPYSNFKGLLVYGEENSRLIDAYVRKNFDPVECSIFYVGELPSSECLMVNTNLESLEFIKKYKKDLKDELEKYINSCNIPIILFKKKIKNNNFYLGWIYTTLINRKRNDPEYIGNYEILTSKFYKGFSKVERLKIEVFTKERIYRRSAGLSSKEINKINIGLVGLGSIGSNLIPFIKPLNINKILLVDKDLLSIENIGRHFLGMNYVGVNKAKAIKDYLEKINPYYNILIKEKSLADVITNNPHSLNISDVIIISIGDTNSEIFADMALKSKILKKPLLFIWVEPYLAGGHCVYVIPESKTNLKDLFEENYFTNNIISKEDYRKNLFNEREAGCQTTFTPYSLTNIMSFLSSIYPKILDIINGKINKGVIYTWIGDTKFLKDTGIRLSKIGLENSTGKIIEKYFI